MTRPFFPVLFMAALTALAAGCSSETTPQTDTGPTGNPVLAIIGVNSKVPSPDLCIEVADPTHASIPLLVTTTTYQGKLTLDLRPPGYCKAAGEVQCGHLVVRVNGEDNSETATRTATVILGKLANPYGDIAVAIQAVDDSGAPISGVLDGGKDPTPLVATTSFKVSKDCGGKDGGSGGTGGGSSSSAASSGSGMGGASSSASSAASSSAASSSAASSSAASSSAASSSAASSSAASSSSSGGPSDAGPD